MGFIRGGLLIVVCIILFIVLLLGNVFFVLSSSLKYGNVQKELGPVLKDFTEGQLNIIEEDFNLEEEMEEAQKFMEEHCQNESSYVFAEGGYTFVIPCEILDEIEESPSAIVEQGIENIIEQIYYDDYDCNFWDCFETTELPLFLVSEKAKNYWQEKFYLTLIVFVVLVVLIFFLTGNKQNTPVIVGSLLVLSSLPLLKLEKIIGSVVKDSSYLSFVGVFFSKINTVFWIVFIVGLIILGAGISLRLLHIVRKKGKKNIGKDIKKKK